MLTYKKVFENNRRWLEDRKSDDNEFFEKLSEEQNPDFMIIGCSDSRVPIERITGAQPGDIFVHRNIANIVSKSDLNILSAIQFAVNTLKVKHIVVCGHTGCGGVKAAMESEDKDTSLGSWLSNIRYIIQKKSEELNKLSDEEEQYKRLIELNTIEQCNNISSLNVVRSSQQQNAYPAVHAWVYDIETGRLDDLDY